MDGRVLVVDDDPHVQYTLRATLKAKEFDAVVVSSAEAALERLRAEPFDVVLLDVMLEGGMSGMKALPLFLRADPDLPVILMTAYGSREMAYEAIQKGAYDFFDKPFKVEELAIVVRRALERRRLVREVVALTQRLGSEASIGDLIAQSPAMKPVLANLAVVSNTDVLALLLGENGTYEPPRPLPDPDHPMGCEESRMRDRLKNLGRSQHSVEYENVAERPPRH